MAFRPKQTFSLLCLVLVITRIANTYVNATAQQLESKTLSDCPITQDDHAQVRSNLLQELGTMIEQLSEETIQPPTPEQTIEQTTASPTPEQTIEQTTASPTTDPLYTCNGTPGWRQVVFINMTDTSYNCPPGLNLTSYSKRTCGRAHSNMNNCSSTTFSVGGSEYSQVCGRIQGYQVGATSAFFGYLVRSHILIDDQYVDGVSLTHGAVGSRQHIWTYVAGVTELDNNRYLQEKCPCDVSISSVVSPPFVGNDYLCESGLNSPWVSCGRYCGVFFPNDLWDGQNCTSTSTCCQFNSPPWFIKNLPNPTTDNIELRLCLYSTASKSDNPLDLIEMYVK